MHDDEHDSDHGDLAARLDAQERAREIVSVAASATAPPGLRRRVEALGARRASRRPRFAIGGALAAGLAALAVLVLVILPGGGPGPSVAEAAALGTRAATDPPPAAAPGSPALLAAEVDGVAFPAWDREFGWVASGRRSDRLAGREAGSVVYEKEGRAVTYTIVSGDALEVPDDATATTRDGVRFTTFAIGGRNAVTWERSGRTCVLSGAGVPVGTLLKLAAWRGDGAIEF